MVQLKTTKRNPGQNKPLSLWCDSEFSGVDWLSGSHLTRHLLEMFCQPNHLYLMVRQGWGAILSSLHLTYDRSVVHTALLHRHTMLVFPTCTGQNALQGFCVSTCHDKSESDWIYHRIAAKFSSISMHLQENFFFYGISVLLNCKRF